MKCTACGGEVPENAAFCPLCGQSLSGAGSPHDPVVVTVGNVPPEDVPSADAQPAAGAEAPGAQADAQPVAGAGQAQPQPSEADAQPVAGPSGAPQAQQPYGAAPGAQPYAAPVQPYAAPAPQPQPQPQSQPQPQPVYAEGCVSAAMADIRATDGWFKRMMFLGLVGCVPILNFTVQGYALNWSREVPFGGRTVMPKSVVNGKNFEIGFYNFVIILVFNLVSSFVAGIVAIVPLLGWLAAIAIALVASVFTSLCAVRMAMMQQLGEGFRIGEAWKAFKRNWTGLAIAVIGPGLVAAVVVAALVSIGSVFLALGIALPASLATSAGVTSGVLALFGALGIVGVLVFVALVLVSMGISMIAHVVVSRAVAHWIGRYAHEWTAEAGRLVY
ncbi:MULTISPECIES: zinc ribbon domain-containing protein [unclassified Adlercreutzia]|uniref:zinc ribbon domain-containing protein n=1 Tax=unclassified Adlercreutzia TaxID=2636013 RepID=UPI0013EC0FD3|nr:MULTISPECIES: zinc ribbon domain-containing protein [unclassified Adlercreutzia]